MSDKELQPNNPWQALQQFTDARIGIGRTGTSIIVSQMLGFKLAHAHARDAVYSTLAVGSLTDKLKQFGLPVLQLNSKAKSREHYLQIPYLGRQLDHDSAFKVKEFAARADVAIIIADGLSATAINNNIFELLQLLLPKLNTAGLKLAPLCLVTQGRVAIGDDIASLLQAKLSLTLIGERPGLSAADSMGAYLTYTPRPGLTDEARNCVSNIRPQGLSFIKAADNLFYLIQQAFYKKLSGAKLKDDEVELILSH